MKKILETERLILREYTPDDFEALYAIVGDAETMKHFPKPYDERGTKYWISWSMEHCAEHGFGFWAVISKETGELIGNCGLTMQIIDGEVCPRSGITSAGTAGTAVMPRKPPPLSGTGPLPTRNIPPCTPI